MSATHRPTLQSNFLVQCWPRWIQTKLQIIFLREFFCGLWANIAQVIFLCNFGQVRSREDLIHSLFSWKKIDCMLWANIAQVIFLWNVVSDVFWQHRLDNISMQCWVHLEQHCKGFFYLCNVAQRVLRQHWTGVFYAMLSRASRTTLHKGFSSTLSHEMILLGQYCKDKNPVQCCPWSSR